MNTFLESFKIAQSFVVSHIWIFWLLIIWSLVWKGFALWKSARLSHKWWFIAILILNTVGILEIFYLFFVGRDYSVKVEEQK
ncbi:MAG: hypothetical protein CO184_00130 [Candidatus Zambryskibacteria bacterium CG_4_9_14_3_um_filter_40_16]|uniref:DUF5652 domain-containing protein n=2 Tax=Candidatus Zambryskiibacteriota TaxID=1817925 RepID=A0A2H0K6V9_9BACT|nr:MAG: hypothetical protein COV95_01160 [Candidatus Zambryskibacteria bacterium CG11_big_fil_rev_8_21_14_0_20_40_24]PJA34424.1 MAG: hypothetical protein CO184_00130 [Candidatus Zambryskibacteria bacterium CG_4_9_14_3_um_filter_40_16]